jgi:dolichol-phosphate mannosyltransferase
MLLLLSRNFGHQAALSVALDHVTGYATIVMDGDLQDSPEAIPLFVAKYFEGYDVVYAQRTNRKEAWPLRLCYFAFYRLMARLSDVESYTHGIGGGVHVRKWFLNCCENNLVRD